MPGNTSRRNRAKNLARSKRQGAASQAGAVARQPAVAAQPHEPAPVINASAYPRVSPARPARSVAQANHLTVHPYVSRELRTIGILVSIMLILLVVLARVFA